MKHVIGIDPSMAGTGIATWRDAWTVRTNGTADTRLQAIYRAVLSDCANGYPDDTLVVVEDLPTHAHGAGKTGMAQGVVRLALLDAGVTYVTVVGSTLKKYATGKGTASKPDMRMALYKRTGLDWNDDNKVDAWWLRQMGLDAVGHPDAIKLPKAQRESLLVVKWPESVTARLLEPYERPVELEA